MIWLFDLAAPLIEVAAHWDARAGTTPMSPAKPGAWELSPAAAGMPRFGHVADLEPYIAGWLTRMTERDDRGYWLIRQS
jgi:hypothetical protein